MNINDSHHIDLDIFLNLQYDPPNVRGIQPKSRTFNQLLPFGNLSPKMGRLSNNVFKAPLRLFIKIILKLEGPGSLSSQVRAISREKNLQTFPKLVCFCQRQGIRSQISQIWSVQVQKYLEMRKQQLPIKKYQQIEKWANKMTQSLAFSDWPALIAAYWGEKVRHKDKLKYCIEEIQKINNYEY